MLVMMLIVFQSCPAEETKNISLLLSGDSAVYQKVAANTIKRIKKFCADKNASCANYGFKISVIDKDLLMPDKDDWLAITFGTKAAEFTNTISTHEHLILSMLPRQSTIPNKERRNQGSEVIIFIDQPYARYFELIRATMPRAARVGLLLHESDQNESESLSKAATDAGLILNIEYVNNPLSIGESLSRLLGNIDVFLAIPDSRIHNNKTISNILTTAYRNHIPVVGFSSAYVKAGAAEAIYTSLDDIAHQVADVAIQLITQGHESPRVQQAKYFSISFNSEVARSLGLTIRSPSAVENTILEGLQQ